MIQKFGEKEKKNEEENRRSYRQYLICLNTHFLSIYTCTYYQQRCCLSLGPTTPFTTTIQQQCCTVAKPTVESHVQWNGIVSSRIRYWTCDATCYIFTTWYCVKVNKTKMKTKTMTKTEMVNGAEPLTLSGTRCVMGGGNICWITTTNDNNDPSNFDALFHNSVEQWKGRTKPTTPLSTKWFTSNLQYKQPMTTQFADIVTTHFLLTTASKSD